MCWQTRRDITDNDRVLSINLFPLHLTTWLLVVSATFCHRMSHTDPICMKTRKCRYSFIQALIMALLPNDMTRFPSDRLSAIHDLDSPGIQIQVRVVENPVWASLSMLQDTTRSKGLDQYQCTWEVQAPVVQRTTGTETETGSRKISFSRFSNSIRASGDRRWLVSAGVCLVPVLRLGFVSPCVRSLGGSCSAVGAVGF
ncbi:hypothetical protein H4582DRAFT_1580269 [Lactarius indigo]|nr:hypothetical protein H4582DRAFT_1580269 [Lactarius indigo]